MLKIVFVILHYNVIQETYNCVASIFSRLGENNFEVVIVDNASPNGTGAELFEHYKSQEKVHVVLHKSNDGFARGNNVGISFAKKELKADFVCCLNNDTLVISENFYEHMIVEWKTSHAAAIGPYIMLPYKLAQAIQYMKDINVYKELLSIYQDDSFLEVNKMNLRKRIIRKVSRCSNEMFNRVMRRNEYHRQENTVLHGCCIIFTPTFFEHYHGFDDRTFLYREEELLYLMLKKKKLKSVYTPCLAIKHMEDAATNTLIQTSAEKRAFFAKHQIASVSVLIKEMETI